MSYAIRDATPDDVDDVLAFWRDAEGVTPTSTDNAGYVGALVSGYPGGLILAVAGERVIGTIICGFDGWRANLYRLAVEPAYRHLGVARALVATAEARVRALGARRIHAMVESDHPLAVGFWSRTEYEAVPRIHPYMGNLAPLDEEDA